jgi:hypothetical protein
MTEKKIEIEAAPAPSGVDTEYAEERRAAARRRFLRRGAASGAILTFFHQRSYAWQTKTILVSSQNTCMSLGGTPSTNKDGKKVMDSVTKNRSVTRYECTVKK